MNSRMCCADTDCVLEMKLPAARYILRGLNPQGVQRGSFKKKKNLAVNTSFVKGSRFCLKTLEEKSNNYPFCRLYTAMLKPKSLYVYLLPVGKNAKRSKILKD